MADETKPVSKKAKTNQGRTETAAMERAAEPATAAEQKPAKKAAGTKKGVTKKARAPKQVSAEVAEKTPVTALRRIAPAGPKAADDPVADQGMPALALADIPVSAQQPQRQADTAAQARTPAPLPGSVPTPEDKPYSSLADMRKDADADEAASSTLTVEQRQRMIREAAYYKAEKRLFQPGFEAEDWFEAERELDEKLDQ